MRLLKTIVAAGLLLGTPALAQQGAAPAPALSEQGKKIVLEHMQKQAATINPLMQQKRQLQGEFEALLGAPKLDEARLSSTIGRMKAVEGQLFDTMSATMVTLLKSLPDNDRILFVKSLSRTPPAAAAKAK